jgi:tetratricopeptide (TPR) repeat protein
MKYLIVILFCASNMLQAQVTPPAYDTCGTKSPEKLQVCNDLALTALFKSEIPRIEFDKKERFPLMEHLVIRFVVKKDGAVDSIEILNSRSRLTKDIVKTLKKTSGKWRPAMIGDVAMDHPYVFGLKVKCAGQKMDCQYSVLDTFPPYYQAGKEKLQKFIDKNLKIPEEFKYSGTVFHNALMIFLITPDGYIDSNTIRVSNLQSCDYRLAEEAMRITKLLCAHRWEPKRIGETRFKSVYMMGIGFSNNGELDFNKWESQPGISYYYNLGVSLLEEGKFKEAENMFTKAIYINPVDIDALYNRGVARFKQGNKAGACADWKKSSENGDKTSLNLYNSKCGN